MLIKCLSVTIECELNPIFSDLWFCLIRITFGRLMLIDDVIVNVLLFTGSYSLTSSFTTILNLSDFSFIEPDKSISHMQSKRLPIFLSFLILSAFTNFNFSMQ